MLFILIISTPASAEIIYCDNCTDCSDKIQNATVGDTVTLTSHINNFDGTCIDFGNSSGIIFDGNGYLIDGNDDFNGNGIYLQRDSNNNIIKNCTITDFRKGIYLYHSDHNTIENISSCSNRETGVTILYSEGNIFSDCVLQDNPEDFYFRPNIYSDCDNTLMYVTGSDNKPIGFYNETVDLSNMEFSSLYLCNADESIIDNVTVSDNLRMYGVDRANMTNIVAGGLYLDSSYDCTIKNASVCDNSHYNIQISTGYRNTLENIISTGSQQAGIYLYHAQDNSIINATVNSNVRGIVLDTSSNTLMNNSYITDNRLHGICIMNSGYHLIYNNYFNNSVNVAFVGLSYPSCWNTTIVSKNNIIGGPHIGGNYWSDYTGVDTNKDGFIDVPYDIGNYGINFDYLPITPLVPEMCGDVDGNGYISANDVIETYRHAVNPEYVINEWAADVDCNGYISANDVVEIYRTAVNPNHTLNCIGN